jgi:hypothetical protein
LADVYAQLRARPWSWVLLGVIVAGLTAACALYLPQGVDWHEAFRPAALALLSGKSPYSVPGYLNAPWALLPIIPFAILPEAVGRGAMAVVGLACFAFIGLRLGARPITLGLFLFSPPVLHSTLNSNLDWLALLGVVLPPNVGLLLLACKPQIGIAVILFQLVESGRTGGVRRIAADFWPLASLSLLSLLAYGPWPLRFSNELGLWWNASLWPGSIPFGLAFLAVALSRRKVRPALVASPLLSPYVLLHSWVGALAATLESLPVAAASVLGLWLLMAIRALGL